MRGLRRGLDGFLTHIRAVGWNCKSVTPVLSEDLGGSVEDGFKRSDGVEAGFVANTAQCSIDL